ncbi:MAG: polysaccharide biosynthesis tyrosine autokinase [Candidatus Alcyoniella australis]|nr:polysaccharide biosynthesis tyrosine autokinase [Candidatus Alcyoniella australis]
MNRGMPYPTAHSGRSEAASLADYLRIIYRRRLIAALTFAVVFIGTAIWTILATPLYEASSTVQVLEEGGQDTLLSDLAKLGKGSPVADEMEIIRSRTVAEGVVGELQLDRRIIGNGDAYAQLVELNVPPEQMGRPYELRFVDENGAFEISDPDGGTMGTARSEELFKTPILTLRIDNVRAKRGDLLSIVQVPFEQAVWEVQDNTRVRQVGEKTNIIGVSYTSRDPLLAARVVNALVTIYRRQNIEQRSAEASQTLSFIQASLQVVQEQLDSSEDELQRFKSENGVMLLSSEAEALIEQLARFEAQLYEVRMRATEVQQVLDHLLAGRAEQALTMLPAVQREDVVLSTHGIELAELVKQRRGLLSVLTENHPEVRAVQAQIEQVQDNIEQVLLSSRATLLGRAQSLQGVVDDYLAQLGQLPSTERDLASLARTRQVNEGIYTLLLQKREEARIAKAATVGNIRVIDSAIVPKVPVRPKVKLNLLMGLIVGLLAALGAAFLLEFVDDSIRTVEEVERLTGKPSYGTIPRIADSRRGAEAPPGISPQLVTRLNPKSPASEAFRSLRTNLQFGDPDHKLHTLLVTSAGPGEGKSTISANLAVTIAAAGRRVLLIDADLRKPSINRIFQIEREPGLTNVLTGQNAWRDVVRSTQIEGLDVLASGPIPPNPTEIMYSKAMRGLLDELRQEYEMLIFDSPPVIAVTDAAILGAMLDATLLVVELGRARADAVQRAISLLANVDANLLGVVSNNISMAGGGHYGYYYYYQDDEGSVKRKRSRRARSKRP